MAAGDGLISMTPTSIAYSGTSAVINADGGVDFTAVTSLSLNGVFTSAYDNYLIVLTPTISSLVDYYFRLRASGTDSTSGYTNQRLFASGSTVGASRTTGRSDFLLNINTSDGNGMHIHLYGPALSQATAFRSVGMYSVSGAIIDDNAGTHSTASSYDGFTVFLSSPQTATGTVHVFGYEE